MEIFEIKDEHLQNSDLSKKIFKKMPHLLQEKEDFENFVQQFQESQLGNGFTQCQKTESTNKLQTNRQEILEKHFDAPKQQLEITQFCIGQRQETEKQSIFGNPFKSFMEQAMDKVEQKIGLAQQDPKFANTLQTLDDNFISKDNFKVEGEKLVFNEKKNDIKTLTFVISGFLTAKTEASDNFKSFVRNTKKTSQPESLIINFRWQSSSLPNICKQLIEDLQKKVTSEVPYNREDVKLFLKSFLKNTLDQSYASEAFKNAVYFIIRTITLFIETPILEGLTKLLLDLFLDMLNSILHNFLNAYINAKQAGQYLSEFIHNLTALFPNVNIDLMGHSLGTVVIFNTLSNLNNDKKVRYIICMGGAATVNEILSVDQKFLKCFNFFSKNDNVIKQLLVSGAILGSGKDYLGLNHINNKDIQRYVNKQLTIDHMDYSMKYDEYHDEALRALTSEIKKITTFIPDAAPEEEENIHLSLGLSILSPQVSTMLKFWQKKTSQKQQQ